jgi:hypothetical protein
VEEKRKDLISSKQKELINLLLAKLHSENPSFYYLSATEVAHEILRYIEEPGVVTKEEMLLLQSLSQRDVQLILGLHS